MNDPLDRLRTALADRYGIERQLGQGGMATVYLAHDIRHDRKVALKVLKPELAAVLGADRFVVEIKTTAALQHPHILPLFDSGTADGFLYYVMPYIQGETLRSKLDRETQLGIDDAVKLTVAVADALDYAHRHGVIHRDIKPENILLHDGRPMVADFGIALALSAAAGGRMTETGMSLGTPHYMSPEQATADKEISARSDVYSLASVLYEMLTGSPPHTGSSAQQIIMKIIAEPAAPVTTLRKSVPPNVAAALARALEKLPADRFGSAAAFAEALSNPAYTFTTGTGAPVVIRPASSWRERAAIPALGLAAVLAGIAAWALLQPAPPAPVSRYQIELPEGKRVGATNWSPLAVSPDGSKLVYLGETGRLFLRSRDQIEPVEIPGTDLAFNPFFSPDGLRVGFMSGAPGSADIKVASLAGAPPTTVTSTGVGGPGAGWGADGFIYFDASGVGPLRRVRATGGAPEDVSVLDSASGELQHNWPDPLPNARGVLMTVDRGGPGVNVAVTNDIAVLDLTTRKHKILVRGVFAKYAATGHIVYVTASGVLMAVPFDQDRQELTGPPVALWEGISIRRGGGGVDLALSPTGALWYGTGYSGGDRDVLWATPTGQFSPVDPGWVGDFGSLALSPDGKRLAISITDATGEQIWVKQVDRARGALAKATFAQVNGSPQWHPDGSRILFITSFVTEANLRSARPDGSSEVPTVLLDDGVPTYQGAWSPNGEWLVYERRGGSSRDLYAMRTTGDTTRVPLVTSGFREGAPSVSPDGRWLLYESNQTSRFEVYLRPFPNPAGSITQVSTAGGRHPVWSRDGRAVFFSNGNEELVRAEVSPGQEFAAGEQRVLFSLRGVTDWDVAPGDQRFVVIRERSGLGSRKLVVVENFFEELNAKVPR